MLWEKSLVLFMIGIVIVSHSVSLANTLVEMAQQMTPDKRKVPLAAAGGIDALEHPFVTNVIKIQRAKDIVKNDK